MLGTGNLELWVKRNASESVNVEGFQTDVNSYYKQVDAFILMSEYENCPISVLEAMSYSLPIITSGAGGIAEQVKNGYNGLIINRDSESIRHAVAQLAENPDSCRIMGKNSFLYCKENFDICKKVEEIHHAIEQVIKE